MSDRRNSHIEVSSIVFDEEYSYKRDCNTYAVTFKYVYDDPKIIWDDGECICHISAADELDAMVKFKNRRLTNLEN